jgi:hypothetical protein
MLLRRITEHIRTQNWFAVGIDFLIVVVGVYIGIQVANWNVTRQRFVEAQRQIGASPVDKPSMEELVRLFGADTAMTATAKEFWLFTNFHLRMLHSHQQAAQRFLKILENAVQP